MQPRFTFAVLIGLTTVFFGGRAAAVAQNGDPFEYLDPSYTPDVVINNDRLPTLMTGADAFFNGTTYAILYDDGLIEFYHDGQSTPYDAMSVGCIAPYCSGITELPDHYPGPIAVCYIDTIEFWDFDGNTTGVWPIDTAEYLLDITYDAERDRILVVTVDGFFYVNEDHHTLTQIHHGTDFGMEIIDLSEDDQGSPIDDMLHVGGDFFRVNEAGEVQFGNHYTVNFGTPYDNYDGMAYTRTTGVLLHTWQAYVYYDQFRFLPYMNWGVTLGDFDGDGDVDADDYAAFVSCFTGPGGGPLDPECEPGDFDYDGDIDCDDWTEFKLHWTGPPAEPPLFETCDLHSIPAGVMLEAIDVRNLPPPP